MCDSLRHCLADRKNDRNHKIVVVIETIIELGSLEINNLFQVKISIMFRNRDILEEYLDERYYTVHFSYKL